MADTAAQIRSLAAPLAEAEGLDLVDVQLKGSGSRCLVRVLVDRKGGVDLEACRRVSSQLSAALDEADPIESHYSLEVGSPGTDHPLEGRRAFERVEGRAVLVHHRQEPDGAVRQLRGSVTGADDDAVVLDVDGGAVRLPYDQIVKATQALPW